MRMDRKRANALISLAKATAASEMRVIEILQSRFLENAGDAAALMELAKLLPVCDTRLLVAGLKSLAKNAADQEDIWAQYLCERSSLRKSHLFDNAPAQMEDTLLSRITINPGSRPINQEAVVHVASIPQEVRDEARAAGVTTQADLLKVAADPDAGFDRAKSWAHTLPDDPTKLAEAA
jgi:hypothetical protein